MLLIQCCGDLVKTYSLVVTLSPRHSESLNKLYSQCLFLYINKYRLTEVCVISQAWLMLKGTTLPFPNRLCWRKRSVILLFILYLCNSLQPTFIDARHWEVYHGMPVLRAFTIVRCSQCMCCRMPHVPGHTGSPWKCYSIDKSQLSTIAKRWENPSVYHQMNG